MSNDIKNISYRMKQQINLAMHDIKNVKKNINEIEKIIDRNRYNRSERIIEEKNNSYEYKNEEDHETNNSDISEKIESPRAGISTNQHNMTHNRWISSLRNPFSFY